MSMSRRLKAKVKVVTLREVKSLDCVPKDCSQTTIFRAIKRLNGKCWEPGPRAPHLGSRFCLILRQPITYCKSQLKNNLRELSGGHVHYASESNSKSQLESKAKSKREVRASFTPSWRLMI